MIATVTIEELQPASFELAARWLSKEPINRWLTAEWRNRTTDPKILAIAVRNRKNRIFLVRSGETACGLVGLADIDLSDKTAMAWYLLGEDKFSGQGVTSSAVLQMAQHGFEEMHLESIYAWIMADNAASRRVLEKSGFAQSGRIRRAANSNGTQVDRIYFDLIANQWPSTDLPR
jgi:RimJ/RimL family protein N-acetyltransferase